MPNSYKCCIEYIGLIILGQVLTKVLNILKIFSRGISTLFKMINHIVQSYLNDKVICRNGKKILKTKNQIGLFYCTTFKTEEKENWSNLQKILQKIESQTGFYKLETTLYFLKKKDLNQSEHLSNVVYFFVCASWNGSYIGQICQHSETKIDEHFGKDKKSSIFQHLM